MNFQTNSGVPAPPSLPSFAHSNGSEMTYEMNSGVPASPFSTSSAHSNGSEKNNPAQKVRGYLSTDSKIDIYLTRVGIKNLANVKRKTHM